MFTSGQVRIGTERHSHTGRWMGRREFMTLIGGSVIFWPLVSNAQQPTPAPPKRLGVLSMWGCKYPRDTVQSRRLAELGWTEGQNLVVECVSGSGRLDELQARARELVSRRPDVLITSPPSHVRALQQATTTIPIVMFGTPDPLRLGLVTNLARPEGNITGVAWFGFDILPKRIELLKEIVPYLRRLAIIRVAAGDPKITEIIEEDITKAASKLGFTWQHFRPVVASDYDEIFARLAAEHFDAVYVTTDPLSIRTENATRIIHLALRHLIPAVGEVVGLAKEGLLLTYSQDSDRTSARVSEYLNRILLGSKPSDLPVEQGTNFQLVINLKTAKTLGLTVPPSLIARADEVVE
jgi:putative tryptophan/tyrosine transport system substrate-binding protein